MLPAAPDRLPAPWPPSCRRAASPATVSAGRLTDAVDLLIAETAGAGRACTSRCDDRHTGWCRGSLPAAWAAAMLAAPRHRDRQLGTVPGRFFPGRAAPDPGGPRHRGGGGGRHGDGGPKAPPPHGAPPDLVSQPPGTPHPAPHPPGAGWVTRPPTLPASSSGAHLWQPPALLVELVRVGDDLVVGAKVLHPARPYQPEHHRHRVVDRAAQPGQLLLDRTAEHAPVRPAGMIRGQGPGDELARARGRESVLARGSQDRRASPAGQDGRLVAGYA
jgi:hypothetical protein